MTLYRSPEPRREQQEMRDIQILARESKQLAPKFEKLALAVYQVLSNHRIQDQGERTRLFGVIMAEIKRAEKPPVSGTKSTLPDSGVREDWIIDAHARQNNQHLIPPDAWSSEAEELARKPLHPEDET